MEKKSNFKVKLAAMFTAVALVGAVFGVALTTNLSAEGASAESLSAMTLQASTAAQLDSPFKAVYADASQSIVGVKLTTQVQVMRGRIMSDTAYVGSGVAIGDGYVVTNYHVVTANTSRVASDILIVYDDKDYAAAFVAGDETSDIAVLKVDGLPAPAAKIGNSDELSVGDWALVIGNPLGANFQNTLTVGVISGQNRVMSDRQSNIATPMLQTNAQINAGNSGGGLFNIRGELVGITSAKLSNNGYYGMASIEGIGLAIPINYVSKIADDLIEHGKVLYPRIGISAEAITNGTEELTAKSLPNSILIRVVEKDSPADKADLQPYDMILEADGQRIYTVAELQTILRGHNEGDMVELKVLRIPNLLSIKDNEDLPQAEPMTVQVEVKILDQ